MSLYLELAVDVERLGDASRNRDNRCHDVILENANPLLLCTLSIHTQKYMTTQTDLEPLHAVNFLALILLGSVLVLDFQGCKEEASFFGVR